MDTTKFDAKRRLCPDGACIGVIGPNGRCSECGRAPGDAREAPAPAEISPRTPTSGRSRRRSGRDRSRATRRRLAASSDSDFNPGRRLCDDGSCLGVIGPDGRCNVCGTKAA